MEERIRPTRSGLFAIELLIAIGVFALCAAICIGLFVRAEVLSADSADLNRAVAEARNVAECFKAAGGDLERTAELLDTTAGTGSRLLLRYDSDWNRMESGSYDVDVFQLYLTPNAAEGIDDAPGTVGAKVAVVRDGTTRLLVWDIAALEASS